MNQQTVLDFIKNQKLCVVSTINDEGKPQSAVVGFSVNDSFEVTIATSSQSRKFRNITENPNVSLVIGWDRGITVQAEGVAHVLEGQELKNYQSNHYAQEPAAKRYKDSPTERYIAIKIHWLRYTDANQDPWLIEELTF